MEKYPFLSRFQGGWAVRDLMTKALQNSVSSFKKDEKAEALATEERAQHDEAGPLRKKRKTQAPSDSDASGDSDDGSDISLGYNDASADEGSDDDDDENKNKNKVSKNRSFEDSHSGTYAVEQEIAEEVPQAYRSRERGGGVGQYANKNKGQST